MAKQVSLKGLDGFQRKSRPFFIIIFELKNGNFKAQEDFSPLIEKVLAGVRREGLEKYQHIMQDINIYSFIRLTA